MKIEYDQTWCDYLTPCPHNNSYKASVGSYDCFICKYFRGFSRTPDNKHYFVECNFDLFN